MKRRSNIGHVSFQVDNKSGPKVHKDTSSAKPLEGVELSQDEAKYMLPHFTMLVVGKPGSGKTTVIRDVLTDKQFYKKKFDHVLLVSPSANKMEVPVHKDNMNQVFSIKWIEDRLLEFNKK